MVEKFRFSKSLKALVIVTIILIVLCVGSSIGMLVAIMQIPDDEEGELDHNTTENTIANAFCGSTACIVGLVILFIPMTIILFVVERKRWSRDVLASATDNRRRAEIETRERQLALQIQEEERRYKREVEEARKRQLAERYKRDAQVKNWAQEERRARNYEKALNYEKAIDLYEKLELWDDAGRCRKLKRKQKLEELEAQRAKIDIGSIGTTIQDSILNRTEIGTKKKK